MDADSLTALERTVTMAIAAVDPERAVMERQLSAVSVVKREYTGVGFYTTLEVGGSADLLDRSRWKIEDMGHGYATHPNLPAGAMFILWISEGRIVTLEGCTAGGDWPADEAQFAVAI